MSEKPKTESAGKRCTGHCCKAFQLQMDIEEVKRRAPNLDDGMFIADMLIPLYAGPLGNMPPELLAVTDIPDDSPPDRPRYVYTCRHFDGVQCTTYETRPKMCRHYPYGGKCEFKACEWEAARTGLNHVNVMMDEAVEVKPHGLQFSLNDLSIWKPKRRGQ